ncbi:MAG TPA: hypothetical protein VFZ16_01655 [Hyphomicrobiaceae bacterium]|nr:hypothetical protein [Hyphomicrobiaceae bacterium]
MSKEAQKLERFYDRTTAGVVIDGSSTSATRATLTALRIDLGLLPASTST